MGRALCPGRQLQPGTVEAQTAQTAPAGSLVPHIEPGFSQIPVLRSSISSEKWRNVFIVFLLRDLGGGLCFALAAEKSSTWHILGSNVLR